jgi:hypothetical protein
MSLASSERRRLSVVFLSYLAALTVDHCFYTRVVSRIFVEESAIPTYGWAFLVLPLLVIAVGMGLAICTTSQVLGGAGAMTTAVVVFLVGAAALGAAGLRKASVQDLLPNVALGLPLVFLVHAMLLALGRLVRKVLGPG